MTLLAALLIVFLDATVIETDEFSLAGAERPDLARQACTEIARRTGEFSGLTVKQFEGPVRGHKTGQDYPGCRVASDGGEIDYHDDKWPHDILLMHMLEDHWQEDISRAADGSGSTAFALRKDSALCVFSATWIIREPFDPAAAVATRYQFEVNCFATRDTD